MEVTASADDVDMLGHVSNIRYVGWVQQVATSHSSALGLDLAAYRELGGVFIVRRHEIDYLGPAFAGDRLRLQTWVESWKAVSSVRMTSISRLADASGQVLDEPVELARGKTLWVFASLPGGRPRRIPASVKSVFADL